MRKQKSNTVIVVSVCPTPDQQRGGEIGGQWMNNAADTMTELVWISL